MEDEARKFKNWLPKSTSQADLMTYLGLQPQQTKPFFDLRRMVFHAFDLVFDKYPTADWVTLEPEIKTEVFDAVKADWMKLVEGDKKKKTPPAAVQNQPDAAQGEAAYAAQDQAAREGRGESSKPPPFDPVRDF